MAERNDDRTADEADPVYAAHGVTSLSIFVLLLAVFLQIAGTAGLLVVDTAGYLNLLGMTAWDMRSVALETVLMALSAAGYLKALTPAYRKFFGTPAFPRLLVGSALDIATSLAIAGTVVLWLLR